MREQTNKILKTLCIYMLVISMMLSNLVGSLDVMAAGTAPKPVITMAAAGSKEVKGKGLLGSGRRKALNITTTIYVTVKNGSDVIEEASTVIGPKETPKSDGVSGIWTVNLQNELVAGQTVYVKQKCNDDMSEEVSAVVKETLASKHKNDLTMPSGDFYLEQFSSNIINDDEKAEALEILKAANPSFANYIESIEFSIKDIEGNKKAYYIVNYTDQSKSEEKQAPNLNIVKVTEHSRTYTLEPYNVVSTVIKGKLNGEGPFNGIKVQFSSKLSEAAKANFCEGGTCTIDKDSADFQTIDVNPQTGEFSINVDEKTLELGSVIGITVKEPHKFATCNSSTTKIAVPKVDVKDPKKLKPEEKKAIVDAIRKANTTASGISKLPDGTADKKGVPAVIQVDDSGNVKIFSGNDVKGNWDPNNGYKFVPETNEDGSYKINDEAKSKTTLDKPEELVKNVAPDAPKLENKEGNVVITPNLEVDTDAKKVVVEYEGADGSKKTITATKTDTGWTVDNDKAKVDENGVVSIPTKEIKTGTKVTASVEDEGGLVPEEKALDSGKAELLIENKYKVTYDANGGSGTMAEEEVEAGKEYTILKNAFIAPADKEFDYWQVGFEKKKAGEKIVVNNDVEITAVYKYVINPTIDKIITKVEHPVNYDMYKKAIKGFPSALKVEHIEVKKAPDISAVGTTEAEIEVRFSDGQFRTLKVTVGVIEDPKNVTINDLNNKVTELDNKINKLNNTITEKDSKITELNGKITELEKQLKTCQEKCAADKAQCEKDKQALRDQIAELEKAKSNLEIQVKENRELIEQLRSQITDLKQQVEDWKKIAGDKDTKIKELEKNIKELNTKLETANNANTDLTKQLATATEKITNLEAKITDLEGQVKDLTEKLSTKETEIKTLNDTITTLKEKIATLEAEKAKDKESYDKDKANLEKQLQEAKDSIATKETELNAIKEELKTANNDLAAEKAKTSGLTEQVKAKDEMITKLNKDIEELKAQLAKAKDGNTTVIKEKETIIKEKEATIEKLTSEKAELEKQLAAEKAKNELLGKQIADLNKKADKAAEDLNKANAKISDLEKQLAVEQEKNKNLTEQLNKITTDLENKTKEVETLNETVTGLKEQLAKITAEQAKDKEAYEKAKAELQEKLDKANQDLADKNTELDKIKADLEQAKKDLADEKAKNAGLTGKTKAQEEKIAGLEAQLKALQDKLDKADTDLKAANDKIAELEKELAAKDADNKNLTAQVEKLGKDLETKTAEVKTLTDKVTELEKQVSEKTAKGEADAKEIERLKAELEDLKNKLQSNSDEADKLSKEIVTLKETVKTLEGEKTELTNNVTRLEKEVKELKEKLETANNKILKLTKENTTLAEKLKNKEEENKKLAEQNEALTKAKETLAKEKEEINRKLTQAESEKTQLTNEKANLQKELDELKKKLDACPADATNQINKLKDEIKQKENQITDKDTQIAGLNTRLNELYSQLSAANKQIVELIEKLNNVPSQPREKEYIYVRDNYTPSYNGDVSSLNLEIEALRRENRELKDKIAKLSQGQDCSLMAKERFVTIFSLKSMLYKTYLGDELMTQAEMMDLKGFIEPFISNNRTMLPLRYVALSLGLDVDWNHSTRTATFTNRDNSNALNPGKITINANTLEMKDQYGNNIAVDSKPMLKNGRFYISITNLTKAFGGTNGNLADGVRNTIEWDSQGRRVLVYKYSK